MLGRLAAVHRRLTADHVPAVLEYQPGLGTVVVAGIDREHPSGRSGVLLHEAGGQYWLRQGGETFRLPRDADDDTLVNSVKLRVVHAWAQQGDPEAAAVLAKVAQMTPPARPRTQPVAYADPFTLAAELFSSAFRFGWTMTVPSPWGMYRSSFTVR